MRRNREGYSNTSSKSVEVIKQDAYIIDVIESCDNSLKKPHQIALVVSKMRPYEDYKKVFRHTARTNQPGFKLTPYSEDLLSAMFGGW